jgi:hypothetical protein
VAYVNEKAAAAESNANKYTEQKISEIPTPDVSGQISGHNTNTAAHSDLRLELQALTNRINAALDSDDTTLDELSEIVAYIKSNKSLIDAITTSKVNVTDIVDDLVTNVANKPLSAAQGVAMKALIDGIANKGYLTSESDPTVPSWAKQPNKPSYSASEVGARHNTWMPSADDVGALPLSGGTMTGKILIGQGNNQGIDLGDNGVIGRWLGEGTWHTFLGLYQGECILAHSTVPCRIRGSEVRPKYNDNDMALASDIPTVPSSYSAASITAGTFGGQVVANASGQTPGTSLLRNSKLVSADTDPTANGEINWTYK